MIGLMFGTVCLFIVFAIARQVVRESDLTLDVMP